MIEFALIAVIVGGLLVVAAGIMAVVVGVRWMRKKRLSLKLDCFGNCGRTIVIPEGERKHVYCEQCRTRMAQQAVESRKEQQDRYNPATKWLTLGDMYRRQREHSSIPYPTFHASEQTDILDSEIIGDND